MQLEEIRVIKCIHERIKELCAAFGCAVILLWDQTADEGVGKSNRLLESVKNWSK